MSGQLVVGINPSNALQAMETTAAGHLKIDLASSGGGAIAANVDVTGNTVGLATESTLSNVSSELSNQSTDLSNIASSTSATDSNTQNIDNNTSNIDSNTSTIASNTTSLAAAVSGNELQVDVITSALPSGAATEATLSAAEVHLGAIDTSCSSIQSNVATSSLQNTANTILTNAEAHLGTIDTSTATASTTLTGISAKLPAALGQDIMSDSLSVVIASNQSSIPVSTAGASATASSQSASPTAGTTTNSATADMNGFNHLTIFGNSSNTTDQIKVQTSNDNSTFYENQAHFVSQHYTSGDFATNITGTGARYYRITQANTTGSGQSLTIITSKK